MKHQQTLNRFILIGIVFAVVFLANYFAYFDDIVRYIPIWTVIFVFYLPIQITLSYSIFHWFKTKTRVETTRAKIGIFVILVAAVLQTIVSVVYFTELICASDDSLSRLLYRTHRLSKRALVRCRPLISDNSVTPID